MARDHTKTSPPVFRGPRAELFRDAIEKAELDGAARKDMVLRLTLRDASEIKRDRNLALQDISFAGGEMRFLGVKVAAGGVVTSRLDRSDEGAEA